VAIYTRSSKCCPIRAEEGITGVLCPPNSSTKFRDLPEDQQIGGYPTPDQLSSSIDEQTLDSEGRCVILEFPAFVLIGVYSPAMRDETRIEFRQAYIDAIDARVRNLVKLGKQVFLCGDLNIICTDLDTAGLPERLKKEGMTMDEFFSAPARRFLNQLVFNGRVIGERDAGREEPVLWDLCREFHPTRQGMYTCWETRKNARPGNFGSRIDYVLCSSGIKDWFIDANIQEGLLGSDHCPVYATMSDVVTMDGAKVHIEDIMNPPGMFKDGVRQREWSTKDLLPTSAKLIPEFDRRRNIKDMFFKKASASSATNAGPSAPQADSGSLETKQEKPADSDPPQGNAAGASEPSSQVSTSTSSSSTPSARTVLNKSSSPQKPPPSKRPAESASAQGRPQKKGKASSNKETPGPGQSTLRGFFKPKTPTPDASGDPPETATPKQSQTTTDADIGPAHKNVGGSKEEETSNTAEKTPKPESSSTEKVFDPIEAKESWSKLLGKRKPPKCEHGEDCQMLVTKKPGVNCGMCSYGFCFPIFPPIVSALCTVALEPPNIPPQSISDVSTTVSSRDVVLTLSSGRAFFMCARPLGPSGEKEQNTPFRCRTFIWSSDWNGRQQ
jgi:AP endonuclease-2